VSIWLIKISGNQDDPQGNPIPYERMTQRGKFIRRDAKRYLAWIEFVQQHWLEQAGCPLPDKRGGEYKLDVFCAFKGERHADPDNIRKGIQDAIFKNAGDKHVYGAVRFGHVLANPFVEFTVLSFFS
jgi:hypothetical protein